MTDADRAVANVARLPPSAAVVTGRAFWAPESLLTNDDLARTLDPRALEQWVLANKWCMDRFEGKTNLGPQDYRRAFTDYVAERIGIFTRHVVDLPAVLERRASTSEIYGSHMGAEAARLALADARVAPEDIELIVCGTSSPDRLYPCTAIEIQDKIGASNAHAWDLLAACSSFAYALHVARAMITSGIHRRILLVSSEYFSACVNYSDPNNAFFWGDAAAACVVERADLAVGKATKFHVFDTHCTSNLSNSIRSGTGGIRPFLRGVARGKIPDTEIEPGSPDDPYFYQDGRQVYRDVVPSVVRETQRVLERHGLGTDDIRRWWFHQPSKLVLNAITKRLMSVEVDQDPRVAVALDEYGNTSSCGAPLCFARDRETSPGDVGCISVFGAGYTVSVALLRHLA